ncbi:Nn.00g075430.m01.CDS01 [Neocucurbitaria sp. VM-36]
MSPYQQIFSTNAILSVWRNLRTTRDHNDLYLTLQYHADDARGPNGKKYSKGSAVEGTQEVADGKTVDVGGKSIGFVVPWRSMQAQRRELREKEKELAEALVVLAGEVAFTDLPPSLQSSLTQNPLIQIRHLAAGLSRQMSKIELQMADNAPFANGKNLYTGGEIAQKFLPTIQTLFEQRPIPQRMIFELLMELKDLVYMGMAGCDKEVLEWEIDGAGIGALEELDDAIVRAVTPLSAVHGGQPQEKEPGHKRLLKRKPSSMSMKPQQQQQPSSLLAAPEDLLYALESLETTALALTHLPIPIQDFSAHAIITLRRLAPRQTLSDFSQQKKRRAGRCEEYARCMKWAGTSWRQGGGCRRGCKNEDEDPENLPSWHRSSRWFDEKGSGTVMVGGGRAKPRDDSVMDMRVES